MKAKYKKIISVLSAGHGFKKVTVLRRKRLFSTFVPVSPVTDAWLFRQCERGWKTAGNAIYDEVISRMKKPNK